MSNTTLVRTTESRVVHDRGRGYTYSFHPAGVVHLDPLESKPTEDQPTERRDTGRKLVVTAPSSFPESWTHPPARGRPKTVKPP
jgi:hypothetical protein